MVLLSIDDVTTKKTSSKRLFQKLHFKLISLVMSDKFAIVICQSSSEINEGMGRVNHPQSQFYKKKVLNFVKKLRTRS